MERAAGGGPASTTSVDAWAVQAFALISALPGVCRVGLALVEGGGRRLRFTATERRDGDDLGWCHVDAYDDVPLNRAVRTGEPVIGPLTDLAAHYPEFVRAQRATPHVAVAAVPVTAAGDVLGGFVAFYEQASTFDRRHRADLHRLARDLGGRLRTAQRQAVRRPARPSVPTPADAAVAVHEVSADLEAVGAAREFLHRTLASWAVDRPAADTAVLCLSELVTNAVVHAHGGCLVHVVLHDGVLTVRVRDSGVAGAAPPATATDPLQVHGRGLQLVEALTAAWGRETDADGASVWFTLRVR